MASDEQWEIWYKQNCLEDLKRKIYEEYDEAIN